MRLSRKLYLYSFNRAVDELSAIRNTVESAHEYVKLLAEVVSAAKQDLEADINRENGPKFPHRLDAIRLASYNLSKLELHMATSSRILNDLRSLRRLLFEERNANVMAAQLAVITKPSARS